MTNEIIGTNAGVIWTALDEKKTLTVKQLTTVTKLTEGEIYAAIGWLARENKISAEKVGKGYKFSLL